MKKGIHTITSTDNINDYFTPFGTWEITTEGDVEGKSIKRLGIYNGNIEEIVCLLKEKCCYNLFIKKLISIKVTKEIPSIDSVKVWMHFPAGTLEEHQKAMNCLFSNTYKNYNTGIMYSSATLSFGEEAKKKIEEENKAKIDKALAKLTQEEKKLLGLI